MTLPNPNLEVSVPEPVYTATKALNSSLVLAGGWLALAIKAMADGSINWAEGYELIGGAVAAGGAVYATWKTRNKRKAA